jgi:hypothetical protein
MTLKTPETTLGVVEDMLRAHYAAIVEEPIPPRLLQMLSLLSRLEDEAELDKVVILRPRTATGTGIGSS